MDQHPLPTVEVSIVSQNRILWRRLRPWLIVVSVVIVAIVVMTWPSLFVSRSRELTGRNFDLRAISSYVYPGREGPCASIYRLPNAAADALDADRQSLRQYPMWTALAFDGYQRVRWQTLSELKAGPDQILATLFETGGGIPDDVIDNRLTEARNLAVRLTLQEDVLIAGWYVERNGHMTNYFVYVLDLKSRRMVKLGMLM
jgi:hypothetical protein